MGDHADKLEAISERICGPMLDTFDDLLTAELTEIDEGGQLEVLHAVRACATAIVNVTIERIAKDGHRTDISQYALSRIRLMMGLGEPQ